MTNFFRPSAPTFCGVLICLHLLYYYNGVYPRLYEESLSKRDGLWCGYFIREPRSFGQFLYWVGILLIAIFMWANYDCGPDEMLDVTYGSLTGHFICEIFFLYRMTVASESRMYNICRSVKLVSVLFCVLSGVFYCYSDYFDTMYGVFFLYFCSRGLLYDGYLYSLGGCSGYHQIAKSGISQKRMYGYASAEDLEFNEPPPPGGAAALLVGANTV